ncbi:hypothetical protein Slala03_76770 [Streptomyces lavendulae subsp. lavendulae]|uniref:hypothetical protein n=1 Tax=Streptomyces lavendulae TaxID=1914 RepID=UPI0024A24711|nr:hypothetical protein [Streptomyces lavendulae]GLV87988.1 hypothetical protein Slala03_76770 [Streptomyces lavendulae subsp. lavendulae]
MEFFHTLEQADSFMRSEIDRPAASEAKELGRGAVLSTRHVDLSDGNFTNVYDLSWVPRQAIASIGVPAEPSPVHAAMGTKASLLALASAAFFHLADTGARPRQATLGLAVERGRILGLPVSDREALVCRTGLLSVVHVPAAGELIWNGAALRWAGSRTTHEADCFVYGNGNAEIVRRTDPGTGSARTLVERSRFTPPVPQGWVDVAFKASHQNGRFVSTRVAAGGLDIFAADLVVRCPVSFVQGPLGNMIEIGSVGPLTGADMPEAAVSVGPSVETEDFDAHPINRDLSLGDNRAFGDRRAARMAVFGTAERTHVRLYDGRPGSETFAGVTPAEAAADIRSENGYVWGAFLDGGQTARICTVHGQGVTAYGNRHYLRWPHAAEERFEWTPDDGRPVGSVIALR